MRNENFTHERQQFGHAPSPTVMRTPLDQWHSLEFIFVDGADTWISIVNDDIDNPEQTVNESRHLSPSQMAYARMRELFRYYESAIAVWYRSRKHNDLMKMRRLRGAYATAAKEFLNL